MNQNLNLINSLEMKLNMLNITLNKMLKNNFSIKNILEYFKLIPKLIKKNLFSSWTAKVLSLNMHSKI